MTDNPKTMTAEERARALWWEMSTMHDASCDAWVVPVALAIQQAIDQARKEGYEKGMEDSCTGTYIAKSMHDKLVLEARKEGFESGYKKGVEEQFDESEAVTVKSRAKARDFQPPREGAE